MTDYDKIVRVVCEHYPAVQAVYLFGTYGTPDEWPRSDVDIALLLPPTQADEEPQFLVGSCHSALQEMLGRSVDLLNARRVSTVFQKEIILSERRIYCADAYAADEFEMLVLSKYQKLNQERTEILAEGLRSGRFYNL